MSKEEAGFKIQNERFGKLEVFSWDGSCNQLVRYFNLKKKIHVGPSKRNGNDEV